jgi:hypothetical protein
MVFEWIKTNSIQIIESTYEYPHFIADINKKLEELDFSLRRSYSERGGEAFLILVNVKQDELSQLATTYTADEIFYIRELVKNQAPKG